MHSRGRQLHRDLMNTYGGMIEQFSHRMSLGQDVPDCLVKTMLRSASVMQWFSALIPSYPEVQRRAQEELDRIVGRDRLPNVEDEGNLPFCRAIIKEVERCHNPFWLGTPHMASEDFTYNGYFIPKDTVLVLNTWTLHHDEKRYPQAHTFNPERYMNDSLTSAHSSILADANKRDHWMFGAGRRICPAIGLAEREIWLTISRMLWSFNMEAAPGQPIDLKEYDGLSGRSPVPFHIYFKPRHENVAKVLAAAVQH
ncbi:hypothetical protein BBP40_009752 [Aspergillus hancockii]|nr:hypothetical protein BBP40_009752 [Aspergillus hancockii]